MQRKPANKKKRTKNQPSRSTKKSKGFTLTSKKPKGSHLAAALSLMAEPDSPKSIFDAVVEGVSMWPTLRKGYLVRYSPINIDRLEIGDIVVLRGTGRLGESRLKVHRFLGRVGPFVLEAGDNTFSSSLVAEKDILGKVIAARDLRGKKISLAPHRMSKRFKFFLLAAQGFLLAHEAKDKLVGKRKSLMLWKVSQLYRRTLGIAGIQVPLIHP